MGKTFSCEFRNMKVYLHLGFEKPINQQAYEYGFSTNTIGRLVVYHKNKNCWKQKNYQRVELLTIAIVAKKLE